MLYSSVKELDPLKVGRFGLGFKSVFHITDYPMVVSGKKLLVINPYTPYSDKVCTSFLLKGLTKYKGMDMKAFREAFDKIFGFGEETLSSGEYRGTLFRFPLRQVGTELSGNVYNKEKIETLFDSFTTEAPLTLLFLKKLEEMTLYRQNDGVKPSYMVRIKGLENSLEKRKEFCQALKKYDRNSMSDELTCCLRVNISVETNDHYGTTQEDKSWFIVNTVLGESNMSPRFRELSKDKDLSYSPYVGIAIPYENIEDFKGHVFCFLPLPLEERSLTGLPVHLNGFFALSQNRRHVKWPSADLKKSAIESDKSLQWNQVLIKEALSHVYLTLIQQLITKCVESNNPGNLVTMVYRAIPCLTAVDVKWCGVLDPILNSLLQRKFLYTENNGGRWIQHQDAMFEGPSYNTDIQATLRLIMKEYKKDFVIIPPHISSLLEQKTSMNKVTPSFLRNLLMSNSWYENCSSLQKLHLLQFLMSDQQYSFLDGLKLLPLEDGSFTNFKRNGCVYMCSKSTLALLPGCEGEIVKQDLPEVITQHLRNIKDKGMFQVQTLDAHGLSRLLQMCMDWKLPNQGQHKVWDTERPPLPIEWLDKVWSKLAKFSLVHFKDLHLVPEKQGKYYHLHKLTRFLFVKSYKSYTLPEAVCRSMSYFSVTVLSALPSFMAKHAEVTEYIHTPTQDSLLSLLDRLYRNDNAYLQRFNSNADNNERNSWVQYLDQLHIGTYREMSLVQMKIFREFPTNAYTSISEVNTLAPQVGNFPVNYPFRLLSSSDGYQCRVAQNLGATQLTEEDAIKRILSEQWHVYSDSDKRKLMIYFIQKIHQFQTNDDLMRLAKEKKFVKTSTGTFRKPSELYDPTIQLLRELIGDDSRFPASEFSSSEILVGLRRLGLISSSPSSDLINSCIEDLDRKVRQGYTTNIKQAEAVNHFLSQKFKQLDPYFLMDKKFLVPQERTSTYPNALPWNPSTHELCAPKECLLATTQNQRIVGSVVSLISEKSYSYLKNHFKLLSPSVTDVLNQLLQIQQNYEVRYKPDFLPCINAVYNFLAEEISTSEWEIRNFFSCKPLVWTGEMFVEIADVYTTPSHGDIPLDPYIYCLPREFLLIKEFFEAIGCHSKQTVDVLYSVQGKIKDKHDGETSVSSNDVSKDLDIIVQILTKYKQDPGAVGHLDVLFPVHTGSETRLQLMPASECRYSNEDWLKVMAEEDEETIYYVHANIPSHTAKALGVRSLTEGLLIDTEAIEPCGQHEDLTGRIRGLLDGYTDGLSVPKEIVQNADDARATKVCFLYDERENMDARTRLIDENMSGFQGPALWAYNDAQFTEADLQNITKLGGATKQDDDTKIGKFGLGFCSVYNLTDVPSFITGSDIVIFDPHYRNLGSAVKGKEPGIKIHLRSLQNQRLVRRMKNQFKPFNGVFGCDMTMGEEFRVYEGTLFRLPLRTNEQAGKSEIKDSAYSKSDIKELLHMLMENGGNMLLFTQNVTEIEVYHLPANATDPSQSTLIYTATKSMINSDNRIIQVSDTFNILKEVSPHFSSAPLEHVPAEQKIMQVDIKIQVENDAKRFICYDVSDSRPCTQWIIAYATGTSESLKITKEIKGVLPLAGIAMPIQIDGCGVKLVSLDSMPFGFYRTGHYFSFLPLPIKTGLPVHINAMFAVAPDRRSIMWGTEDDKTELIKPRWNHSLMTDAVPKAYICLLQSLNNYKGVSDEEYMNAWPINSACSSEMQHMVKAFLTSIVKDNPRIFKRHDIWACFEECRFMEPKLLDSDVGNIAFKAAIHFLETETEACNKVMMLQKKLSASFTDAGLKSSIDKKIFSTEDFFTEVFFPEMPSVYWQSKERNKLVIFAIDNMTDIRKTKYLLQNTKCIPSEPTGELKFPNELIHPESELKKLFTAGEGRFVHKEMAEAGIGKRKKQSKDIGMIVDTLPSHLLVDRVKSVLGLALECGKSAIDRSVNIIQYLRRQCPSSISSNEDFKDIPIEEIKEIPYLPVLQKPKDWSFRWEADFLSSEATSITTETVTVDTCNHPKENVQFAAPIHLYLDSSQHLVGSQKLILDWSCFKSLVSYEENIFSRLGVNGGQHNTIPVEVVCAHLIELCENTNPVEMAEDSKLLLEKICNEIYTFLSQRIFRESISDEEMNSIVNLKEHPVVFCQNAFVKPKQVALRVSVDCKPHLFGLQTLHHGTSYKDLWRVLDIKEKFTTDDVLNVMLEKQRYKGKERLTENEVELYTKLITLLVECIEHEKIGHHGMFTVTDGNSSQLCIPDVDGFLTPINELCLNDSEEVNTTGTMKFVNGKIGPDFARRLGVKAKKKQHFSDNSRKIPFGQKEELTTRIKEILRGYPCDVGIMKELLQNADDAQATELHFIIDDNTYSTERVFDDKWKALQGPALLVYNNSVFTPKDIKGIQDLGIGSKGEDPTKTGQYGVGFNAVYHLTDAPSFLTKGPDVEGGETMCVMDPHCQFLSDATEDRPGIQLVNLDQHRNLYPDVFKCYHEGKLLEDKGTVFRFPLRADNQTTMHLADPMSCDNLRDLLKTFEGDLLETLLFVNSVKKISLSEVSNGDFRLLYEVEVSISDEDEKERTDFGNHLRDVNEKLRDTKDVSTIEDKSVSYNVTVKNNKGVSNTWLIVQRIGVGDGDISKEVRNAYKEGDLGLLPRGGVAISLTAMKPSEKKHKAFCFLPLPLLTSLPVHVNGHFALGGETRSSLWNEERGTYKWEWNKLLLSRVIPSAYITGMQRVKEIFLTNNEENNLVKSTRQLDTLFPIYKEAKDDNWKLLAKEVLNQIYNTHQEFFYLYTRHESSVNACQPVFVPLQQPGEPFPAVFNTLRDHKSESTISLTSEDQTTLRNIMKDIGLRLLDLPLSIMDSLKDAEVPVSAISPEIVMEFMKSYDRSDIEHKCNITIPEGCTDLSSTSLQDSWRVFKLLQYCRNSDEFITKIIGVPLCVTQDEKLYVFKEGGEIFCSELASILPGSQNRFLHCLLVSLCDKMELQGSVFKSLDIPSFAQYLAESLSPENFRNPRQMVDWIPSQKDKIPNSSWLCKVWKFFEQEMKCKGQEEVNEASKDDNDVIRTIPQDLEVVAHWNLVPCTLTETRLYCQMKRQVLSALSNFDKLLDLESFTGELKAAFEKLLLPTFDRNIFDSKILLSLIPNNRNPVMVLNCLHQHRNESRYQTLSRKNSDAILEYFVDHIEEVQKLDNWKEKLKSLSLHCTIHGEQVSLERELKVLVLPGTIPPKGIKEWGENSKTLLLKQNEKLEPLYKAFGCTQSSLCNVYSFHILANIAFLPKDCIQDHLKYIKEKLLLSYDNKYKDDQRSLIDILKTLRIFETGQGELKQASELYSPHVTLFRAMSNILDFPMKPYSGYEWESFMILIGMVKQASNELIIQFACQIETEGRQVKIPDELSNKSESLLQYIWAIENLVNCGLLPKIRHIKFIVPSTIHSRESRIYPQYEAGQLMAFKGAVPTQYTNYVWSSCHILPEMADPSIGFYRKKSNAVVRQLQVCLEKPPLEKVILHTQNICDALKEQCERNVWKKEDEYLKNLMFNIYQYLWTYGANQGLLCNCLRQKPIVYLPSENKFVTCGVLVIHLEKYYEIKPYLYSAPMYFGGNFDLFEKLGTEKRTTCATYARVLERIKQDVRDQELNPNELQSVLRAICGLFSHLQRTKEDTGVCLQVPVLYLPTKDNTLMDSTKMIYSDNKLLYKSIGKDAGLPYFVGFGTLKLQYSTCDIKNIPVKNRPFILSEMVEKRIDVSSWEVTQGRLTNQLQKFIQRPEFVEGLLRIVNDDRHKSVLKSGKVNENDVMSGLRKIKVLQVKDLSVEYVYKEKVVGCDANVFSHIHKDENDQQSPVWYFYTQVPEGMETNRWLRKIEDKFIRLIQESTEIDCTEHGSLLLNFLMEMDHPEMISDILDQKGYGEYSLSESFSDNFLPDCGTYVHEKWHHMLDNTICTFDEDEFVAVLLDDDHEDAMDSDSQNEEFDLYIYAQIVKLVGCEVEGELSPELSEYEVDVGDGRILVKFAYKIYKIIRKKTESQEIVKAVDVAKKSHVHSLPREVIFKEVRRKLLAIWALPEKERRAIFKRYLRQWHPDKNLGNEEQATAVFQYIQLIWDRLTNGDPVSVDDDIDPSQSQPSPNRQFYDNVSRQCSRERSNYNSGSSRGGGGGYRRSYHQDNDPVSNPRQQRKWFKQAELDLAAAEHFMMSAEEVQGYNWICYMSHQSVEKSLKSMLFRKDANSVNRGHDIYGIAANLNDESLRSAAGEMQSLLGNHTYMRYPDVHAAGRIPSTSFTKDMAESALRIARRILEDVEAKN